MSCKIDSQSNHWFKCSRGTVGCPRIHDDRTPHCIACTAGEYCKFHDDDPVLEMSEAEYRAKEKANGR
jgi:hypothetical protein